jgi:hypothetical protein
MRYYQLLLKVVKVKQVNMMKQVVIRIALVLAFILLLAGFATSSTFASGDSWLSGWANRVKITVDHTKITAPLSNFPVLVHLSTSSGINSADISLVFDVLGVDANRKKIAVTASDGLTQLYVEVAEWDSANKQAYLWVKVPSISNTVDTDLYLYYDNAHIDNTTMVGDTGSTPATNVWDSNFKLVQHLEESGNGTQGEFKDSSINQHNATGGGGAATKTPVQTASKDGDGQRFDGNDDFIEVGDSNDFSIPTTGALTVSVWIRPDVLDFAKASGVTGDVYVNLLGKSQTGGPNTEEWELRIRNYTSTYPNRIAFYIFDAQGKQGMGSYFQDTAGVGEWIHIVGTSTLYVSQIFKNGVLRYHMRHQTTGTKATATCTINGGGVDSVTITEQGTLYGNTPKVNFFGGGGSGATATATLTGEAVTDITITNAGSGYTSAPTVAIGITPTNTTANLRFGHVEDETDPGYFQGAMDEVRVSNVVRSGAWIQASYASENDNLLNFELLSNHPPVLNAIGNKSVNEGATLSFIISAFDSHGNTLTYSASNLPTGASFNTSTHAFSWTPNFSQSGTYSNVHFEVSDGSLTDSENITITVSNVNRPPVLNAIGNKTVNEGVLLTFTISASDPDGDSLTCSASNLPQGASFSSSTRTFSWTPGFSQAGTYANIHFAVSDGTLTDSEDITIPVTDFSLSANPSTISFTSSGSGTFSVSITPSGAFADNVTLTASASAPANVTVTPTSATVGPPYAATAFTVTSSTPGTYTVTIAGTSGSLRHQTSVTVTVKAPALSVKVSTDKASYTVGQTVTITVTVASAGSPIGGATVAFSIRNQSGSTVKSGSGTTTSAGTVQFTWNTKGAKRGSHTLRASASKTGYTSGSGSTTFTLR